MSVGCDQVLGYSLLLAVCGHADMGSANSSATMSVTVMWLQTACAPPCDGSKLLITTSSLIGVEMGLRWTPLRGWWEDTRSVDEPEAEDMAIKVCCIQG